MQDLKGKEIGLSGSLNTLKTGSWRIQEQQGIAQMLMLNGRRVTTRRSSSAPARTTGKTSRI
jgi:hypothetical protein